MGVDFAVDAATAFGLVFKGGFPVELCESSDELPPQPPAAADKANNAPKKNRLVDMVFPFKKANGGDAQCIPLVSQVRANSMPVKTSFFLRFFVAIARYKMFLQDLTKVQKKMQKVVCQILLFSF